MSGQELLELAAELVDIPSVSHDEKAIADFVETRLTGVAGDTLEVIRLGDNVCARTRLRLPQRLILAGHLDTVPANGNGRARIADGVLHGLGSADMKGGDAVFLELASAVAAGRVRPTSDLTWVFYVCEEVETRYNGLLQLEAEALEWLEGDAAILGEPTACAVEAGCQGVLDVVVEVRGERAHTARPWMGVNALHRLGPVLDAIEAYEPRRPVVDGCEYREALQAVRAEAGIANNVVPDLARIVVNHRFSPDRSAEEAFSALRAIIDPFLDESAGDSVVLAASSKAAAPFLSHPLLASLVEASGAAPAAKLGWTDVSYFASRGVPAANFGPGEPTLAHNAGECVSAEQLERAFRVVCALAGSDVEPMLGGALPADL